MSAKLSPELKVDDVRIVNIRSIITPVLLCEEIASTHASRQLTGETRQEIHNILHRKDQRLLIIAGPCSIHNVDAAKEYATRLLQLKKKYAEELLVIMRVYFEKPRTTVGWKGLINDPMLDNSFQINQGLRIARRLLLDLNELGMPAATEYLDLITPQYVADLISWGAIGARTTESQVHRELASGLSCPVGFKNGTNGSTKIAVDAISAAIRPHHFISMRKEGNSAIFETTGNEDCHIILRGGKKPNFDAASVQQVSEELAAAGLPQRVMIDLSHANSNKKYQLQMQSGAEVADQVAQGDQRIFGVMIESNLVAGRQEVTTPENLVYGQSITDPCLGWEDTVQLIEIFADAVRNSRH